MLLNAEELSDDILPPLHAFASVCTLVTGAAARVPVSERITALDAAAAAVGEGVSHTHVWLHKRHTEGIVPYYYRLTKSDRAFLAQHTPELLQHNTLSNTLSQKQSKMLTHVGAA